jgi:hypothetical protein
MDVVHDDSDARALAVPSLPDREPAIVRPPDAYVEHLQAATIQQANERAQREIAAKRSRRRRSAVTAVLMALLVTGGWFIGRALISDRHTAADAPTVSAPVAPEEGFSVETPSFRFVMPDTPVYTTEHSSPLPGLDLVGTVWTIESDDMVLQVLAMDFQTPVDDDMAQGAFDSMIGGMKRRAEGTVVLDEQFQAEGVSGRRSIIEAGEFRFYMESYAHGTWIVSIVGADSGDDPPASYTDLIASFSFI